MRKQFKNTVMDLAKKDDTITLIFGDVSVYLFKDFYDNYPDRFYNMGICENTLVSVSAGLSAMGLTPFVHTIAPFITERSYEQIKLDICYNQLGVNIVSCGASFDYAWDGATHHSYTDLAILRLLPQMEVLQPGSTKELDTLLRSQYNNGRGTYFRLSDHPHSIDLDIEFGKGVVVQDTGSKYTIITAGPLLESVIKACSGLDVNILYFHTIKPIDKELIERFSGTKMLVVHDAFGLHEAVCSVPGVFSEYHGLPDEFCCLYGTLQDTRHSLQLDPTGIKAFVEGKIRH